MFFTRTCDDGRDKYERHDFTLGEFTSTAPWVRDAAAIAAVKNQAEKATGGGPTKAISAPAVKKPRVPPSEATVTGWRKQLDEWVANKLKQWDEDETFRLARKDKYPDRDAYATWLQGKADAQLSSRLAQS